MMKDLLESAEIINVPLEDYHQYQGQTNDCGPTTAAILGNAYLNELRFQGPEVAERLNRLNFSLRPIPHFVLGRIPGWATFPWGIAYFLRSRGIPVSWKPFRDREDLLEGIRADQLMAVIIGEPFLKKDRRFAGWSHYLIVAGYQSQRGFLVLDPGKKQRSGGDRWEQKGMVWRPEEEFLSLWRKMFRVIITVG